VGAVHALEPSLQAPGFQHLNLKCDIFRRFQQSLLQQSLLQQSLLQQSLYRYARALSALKRRKVQEQLAVRIDGWLMQVEVGLVALFTTLFCSQNTNR
jgi:hypothetical protein